MRPEIELLLLALKDNSTAAEEGRFESLLRDGIDWHFFNLAAIAHKICPLLEKRLKPYKFCEEKTERIRLESSEIQRKAMMLTARLFRLQRALNKADVKFVFVKGAAVAHLLYDDSLTARSFCDIDLFIAAKDAPKVRKILADEEFFPNQMWCHCEHPDEFYTSELFLRLEHEKEYTSKNRSFAVDLHWGAGAWFATCEQMVERATTISIAGYELRTLEPNLHLIYLCAHAAKHDWSTLVWIADVARALNSKHRFDWRKVARLSRALGLYRTVQLTILLSNQLLEAQIPAQFLPIDSSLSKIAQEIIERYGKQLPPLVSYSQIPFWQRIWHVYDSKRQVTEQVLSDLFKPTFNDWVRVKLPASLEWGYYLVHPATKVFFTAKNLFGNATTSSDTRNR